MKMINTKTWTQIWKAFDAAAQLVEAIEKVETHDKEYYDQHLAAEKKKAMAIRGKLQGAMIEYGRKIDGVDDNF